MTTALELDPRFLEGLKLLEQHDFAEAADEFEELFFEAVNDEVPVVRALMQVSVGCLHAERRQWTAGAGRLAEAVKAIDSVTVAHGIDFALLRGDIQKLLTQVRAGLPLDWPRVQRTG